MIAKPPPNVRTLTTQSQVCARCGTRKPLTTDFWLAMQFGGWFPECLECIDRGWRRNKPRYRSVSQRNAHYSRYFASYEARL